MSDIHGKGHGDQHVWKNLGTNQSIFLEDRFTEFICENCLEYFQHFYHFTPNIFKAMKNSGVPKKCKKVKLPNINSIQSEGY